MHANAEEGTSNAKGCARLAFAGRIPLYIDSALPQASRMWQQRIAGTTTGPGIFRCPSVRDRVINDNPSYNYYYVFAASGESDYGVSEKPASIVMLSERENI